MTKLLNKYSQKFKANLFKLFKGHSQVYNSCRSLPLRIFCEIINTGNTGLLYKSKDKPSDFTDELWGDIIIEYGKLDGNIGISENLDKQIELRALQNAYNTLKSMVRFLWYVSPSNKTHGEKAKDYIVELSQMGYKIDWSNSINYRISLIQIDKRINSLLTLIQMKQNEINEKHEESGIDFDELMAMLSLHFAHVNESVTVARYCKMKNVIKQKLKHGSNKA